MKNKLNIIIIGVKIKEIKNTLLSIKEILLDTEIKIIIICPKTIKLDMKKEFIKNISFIKDNEEGIYQAMNLGLNLISRSKKYSYNWFLNSGDFAIEDKIKKRLSFLKKENYNQDIIFYINNQNINLINTFYKISKSFRIKDIIIIKLLLLCLIFPSSHQNILIKSKVHKYFDTCYKLSSDFNLIAKLIFLEKKDILIKLGSIAHTSKGGLTDLNRVKTIKERFIILKKIIKFPILLNFIPILEINYVLRLLIIYIINFIKRVKLLR